MFILVDSKAHGVDKAQAQLTAGLPTCSDTCTNPKTAWTPTHSVHFRSKSPWGWHEYPCSAVYKNLKWSANVGVWQHALRGFIHEDICWNAKFKSPAKSAKCTHVWLSNKNEISLNTRERRNYF